MTFRSPSLSARKGLMVAGSQSVMFTEALHKLGHTFEATPTQGSNTMAGCVIIAEPALSAARSLAMQALSESRSVLFTHPNAMAACGRELAQLAISQRLYIGTEAALLGHIPAKQWIQNQTASGLTGLFHGAADSLLHRMTHRAEDAITAESQLRLAKTDMEDLSGKATQSRAQVLHGLWQGYAQAPTLSRQSVETVTPEEIARLRRWGMVMRFGYKLQAQSLYVGPLAFAATNPLAGWQGNALSEATDSPTSLLLTNATDTRTAQITGLLTDLTAWQEGSITRTQTPSTLSTPNSTQTTLYLRAPATQRAPILTQSALICEHLDQQGNWQAIVETKQAQYVENASTFSLPTLGTPTQTETTLRLVA